MAATPFYSPKFRAFDANGDPLAGGKLFSYEAGTSTPLDTFTTRAGNIANTNPVILDANGEADVWTTPGVLYKFVLKDALDVIQWTVDNVPSASDMSSQADTSVTVDPGGRLSLTSGVPITNADVVGAATVYYMPQKHDVVPLYDGTNWSLHTLPSELSQALSDATKSPTAAVPSTNYDMFIWDDGGTLRLSRGPAWSGSTTRGTGAGTTELERVAGRYVNKYAISNGPTAQRGLHVGTIRVSGTSSGVDDSLARRYCFNTYNRVPRPMRATEATNVWGYSSSTWRQANASSGNQLAYVMGHSEEPVVAQVHACANFATSDEAAAVGIGLDSTSVNSASIFGSGYERATVASATTQLTAFYEGYPGIGHHTLAWLEAAISSSEIGFLGTIDDATARAVSGIHGHVMA